MSDALPYGKHFKVKRGPFKGKVGLWSGTAYGRWQLSFGLKVNYWFETSDLERASDKEIAAAEEAPDG